MIASVRYMAKALTASTSLCSCRSVLASSTWLRRSRAACCAPRTMLEK
jgi:hypothetical protein